MADWQRKLDVRDVWRMMKDSEWSSDEVKKACLKVSKRLKQVAPFTPEDDVEYSVYNEERESIAEEFETLAEDKIITLEDFNCVLERLYDWADLTIGDRHVPFYKIKKVMWLQTF